ncbi:MAG: hypothetical protein RL115_499 [Bacteroidota bacterium]|jgi:hypothetical protein
MLLVAKWTRLHPHQTPQIQQYMKINSLTRIEQTTHLKNQFYRYSIGEIADSNIIKAQFPIF